jgi:integrase
MPRKGVHPWYRKARDMWFATVNGVQICLEVKGEENAEAAAAALKALIAAAEAKGVEPKEIRSPTIEKAVAHYLAQIRSRVKLVTFTSYEWFLGQFAEAVGPETALAALTAHTVEATADRAQWSSSTRNGYLGAVGTFLRDAGHPLRLRRPPKESRGADAVWTETEWLLMCGAARGDFRPLMLVLRETGCRPSEAAGLTVENVDWANRSARLKCHKTAGKGKARVMHFSDAVMAVLAEQRMQYSAGHLFLNEESRPFTGQSLSRRCELCRERAGVKRPITLYGLRHSYCTKALAQGLSNAQVAALVGNTEAMIAKHYSHIDADAQLLKELAEKISRAG